jgi:undecaprenyl-diphosphatase
VTEDVLAQESGPVDEAVLWFIRQQVPADWSGLFEMITRSGSAIFLLPLGLATLAALLLARRRMEAVLLAGSVVSSTLLVYLLKALVQRPRPDLWDTQWYWGSSFPSGHTLNTAALSIALALCLSRLWPGAGNLAMGCAVAWISLVALSRLVLGVHWPSDVLAAMCIGAFIPLLISVLLDGRTSKATP